MTGLPRIVETMFHDFCEECISCEISTESNVMYADNKEYYRNILITCKNYKLCENARNNFKRFSI